MGSIEYTHTHIYKYIYIYTCTIIINTINNITIQAISVKLTCWYLATLSSRLRSSLVACRLRVSNWLSMVPLMPLMPFLLVGAAVKLPLPLPLPVPLSLPVELKLAWLTLPLPLPLPALRGGTTGRRRWWRGWGDVKPEMVAFVCCWWVLMSVDKFDEYSCCNNAINSINCSCRYSLLRLRLRLRLQ